MWNRLSSTLLGIICCSFLMISCGGGGGSSTTPPASPPASITVSSTEVKFDNVVLNDYLEKVITIKNTGSINLIIGKIADNNPLAAPFRIWSDGCSGNTFSDNAMCIIKVRFSPTTIGSGFNDTFDIPSNASTTVTVSVSGNGIAPPPTTPPPPPIIFLDRNTFNFVDVDLNSSTDWPISIINRGSSNLQIYQITPLHAPFSILSDTCSNKTLAANTMCSLTVNFHPTSQGKYGDSFDIPSNDQKSTSVIVGVSGNVKTPIPSRPSINLPIDLQFGNVVLNNVLEQTILIENAGSSGSDNLIIGQIANINPLVAPFSISVDNCSRQHLAPKQTCGLQVRFSPTSQGSGLSDSFDVPSNDPNKLSVGVNVSGNGRALRVSINEIRTNSCPDISLVLDVVDSNGNLISGLLQDNMAIIENGVGKSITGFSPVPAPFSISAALAIDFSDSMNVFLSSVQSSSIDFINQLNTGIGDEAAIFTFSGVVELKQPFTADNTLLISAINNGIVNGAGTLVYDALWSAIDTAALQTNYRAIILLSDGKDEKGDGSRTQGSVHTLTDVINHAKENGVTIFTIGLGVVEIDVMTQLANETGGQYYRVVADVSSELGNIYTAIRKLLSGKYTVTYTSSVTGSSILLDVFVGSNGMQGEVSRQFQGCP